MSSAAGEHMLMFPKYYIIITTTKNILLHKLKLELFCNENILPAKQLKENIQHDKIQKPENSRLQLETAMFKR